MFQIIAGEQLDVHIVLDDPAGNSHIQVGFKVVVTDKGTISEKYGQYTELSTKSCSG